MAFTDIVFSRQAIWEIPPGTAPGAPVAPGVSILDALTALYNGTSPSIAVQSASVLAAAAANPISSNVKEVNDVPIVGDGSGTPFNV